VSSRHTRAALVLAGSLALTACGGGAPELEVSGAYVPEPVMADMAGGFLTVHNSGDEADALTSVTSDSAGDVQIHKTVGNKMQRVGSLPVPADGDLRLGRGGSHLMLMDLKEKPTEGGKIQLTLRFEKSGPVKVTVPVKATNHVPEK